MTESALIIGAGNGLSASLARLFASEGMTVGLAARNTAKLSGLVDEIGGRAYGCDASDPDHMERLFQEFEAHSGSPDIMVYNPSARVRGPISDIDAAATKDAILVTAYGAFLAAQQSARRMLKRGCGAMLFTGASAGVKGYALSAPFAMGKFALRGLCQSLARELSPQNIHVAHFVIDGGILDVDRDPPPDDPATQLNPDEIAKTYLHIARQDKSAWTWEIELRPSVETF
ncbi:MAG: SDR family NAD(P)-dependent oxidoreductase [Alphaproteobacteria bacterium]|jgi:NAD(P)-dependent dehydrogenase (short-subunit alcohol dehydrogenase family)